MWKSWLLETKLCACAALDYHIMRNKYVSTKTQIFVSQAKEVPGTTFKVNTVKSVVDMKWLLLKFLLLPHTHAQENFREGNAKLSFLGINWESQRSCREFTLWALKKRKCQNFPPGGDHGAVSGTYWVRYKPPHLSYSGLGTFKDISCP